MPETSPPPDPLRAISDNKIDALIGLALTELASIASSDQSRKTIQDAGIRVMEKAITDECKPQNYVSPRSCVVITLYNFGKIIFSTNFDTR